MARKYKQDYKDHHDEHMGMMKRREKEHEGYGGMISMDHSAPANLPQEVKHEYYRECRYMDYSLDDTQKQIVEDIDNAVGRLRKNKPDSRY